MPSVDRILAAARQVTAYTLRDHHDGANTLKLPDLGEGLYEAEIVEWHVDDGDSVAGRPAARLG